MQSEAVPEAHASRRTRSAGKLSRAADTTQCQRGIEHGCATAAAAGQSPRQSPAAAAAVRCRKRVHNARHRLRPRHACKAARLPDVASALGVEGAPRPQTAGAGAKTETLLRC